MTRPVTPNGRRIPRLRAPTPNPLLEDPLAVLVGESVRIRAAKATYTSVSRWPWPLGQSPRQHPAHDTTRTQADGNRSRGSCVT